MNNDKFELERVLARSSTGDRARGRVDLRHRIHHSFSRSFFLCNVGIYLVNTLKRTLKTSGSHYGVPNVSRFRTERNRDDSPICGTLYVTRATVAAIDSRRCSIATETMQLRG